MRECVKLIKKVQQDDDSVPGLEQLCSIVFRWKGGDCARIKFFSGGRMPEIFINTSQHELGPG